MSKAKRCALFWSFSDESAVSRLIVQVTGRRLADRSDSFSHMGVAFSLSDGTKEYYEALFGRKVAGPTPLAHLTDWREENPRRRRVEIAVLPLPPALCEVKRAIVRSWVGMVGYAQWQLLAMWGAERLRWPVPRSPNRMVCSELAARVAAPEIDLTDRRRPNPDYVNPNSAYRRWVELRGAGTIWNSGNQEGAERNWGTGGRV